LETKVRESGQDSINTHKVKNERGSRKELTIMLIGSVGKMRSFKISRKLVLYILIFLLVYIAVSLVIFYLYFDMFAALRSQSNKLQRLEAELGDKTRELEQNKLYIKSLEDFYNSVQKGQKEKTDADITRKRDSAPVSPEVNIPGKTEDHAPAATEAVKDYVEVSDIKFRKTDSVLTLDFKLSNMLAEEKAEGYIHIILMNKDKEYPPEWISAYNTLSDGIPVDYKHGQQFLIKNFRPYQRQYKKNPGLELPAFIRILVYDPAGRKILEKEFPVTGESVNDPG
jgi:hypothetical protein